MDPRNSCWPVSKAVLNLYYKQTPIMHSSSCKNPFGALALVRPLSQASVHPLAISRQFLARMWMYRRRRRMTPGVRLLPRLLYIRCFCWQMDFYSHSPFARLVDKVKCVQGFSSTPLDSDKVILNKMWKLFFKIFWLECLKFCVPQFQPNELHQYWVLNIRINIYQCAQYVS